MIHGIFYGIFITFIFYFTVFAIRQRCISAMWFSFYTVCLGLILGLYQGDFQGYLKHDLENQIHTILITLIGLQYYTGAKFLRTFLNINFYSKPKDKMIQVLQWMGIAFIPLSLLPNPFTLFYCIVMFFIGPIICSGVLISFWIRGVPNTKYVTIGWMIGHITLAIGLLHFFGFTLWMNDHPYLLQVTTTLSIVFFGIAIVAKNHEYHEYNLQDHLTGIASRRMFNRTLEIEWKRNLRNQRPISVIIADIDDFKAFNGLYGHATGDECLKTLALLFNRSLRRAGDMAARYRGKEFIAVLPDTHTSEAIFLAEKIREAFEAQSIKHEQSSTGKILTVSLGTATIVPDTKKNPADILLSADKAIFQAKINGRNRVFSTNQGFA